MRTPITYYGGKQKLADLIISMMPQHKIYVEPYFGGGAVFFKKQKSTVEVVNDLNEQLINFYLAAKNEFPALKSLIDSTLHSERLYYYAKDVWNGRSEATNVEKAWAIWMITNCSFGGSMHGGWKWCNGSNGSNSAIMLKGKRLCFTEDLQTRLENVQISCRDATKVIKDRDSIETFFYLDPPYPGHYQGHYAGYTHNDLYQLLQILSEIKGKFILSNYWCQTLKYHVMKNNWNTSSINRKLTVANTGKGLPISSRDEMLVYNFELASDDLFSCLTKMINE